MVVQEEQMSLKQHQASNMPSLSPEQRLKIEEASKSGKRDGDDALTQTLSAFYCKLLVVLGIAFPVTAVIAPDTKSAIAYDGFYLFLYIGSITFLLYMYATLLREEVEEEEPTHVRRHSSVGSQRPRRRSSVFPIELVTWRQNPERRPPINGNVRYGSFYLRMGVAAFGVGSVIYSGLEFGRYFELKSDRHCHDIFLAVTPLFRISFILIQMIFIFANNKMMEVYRYKVIAKFGLMHMIATNLCEWLYVLVEETKNDMLEDSFLPPVLIAGPADDLQHSSEEVDNEPAIENLTSCYRTNIMNTLVKDTGPYLFPCTVEYSLLCAVIITAMWRNVCSRVSETSPEIRESTVNVIYSRSVSYFSVDCASAYKGLFTSIVLMVITIISLIMFFQLIHVPGYGVAAVLQVNVWEIILFATATIAAVALMYRLQRISVQPGSRNLDLEHILLVVTQSGVFLYSIFQMIGEIFSLDEERKSVINVLVPLAALLQSACQTLVLLDASRRRCNTEEQLREKPGRQLVTFLLVANLAIWAINRMKNSQVEFKPSQMDFYGRWPWTVITHVCVPLVVCYRFQSTVCLYEIWKRVYKMKTNYI